MRARRRVSTRTTWIVLRASSRRWRSCAPARNDRHLCYRYSEVACRSEGSGKKVLVYNGFMIITLSVTFPATFIVIASVPAWTMIQDYLL